MRASWALMLATLAFVAPSRASEPLRDVPVIWYEDDMRDVPAPVERDPNLVWTGVDETFARPIGRLSHPGRLTRRVGTAFGGDHVPPASNVNRLDEVPNSSWFTNRIGLFPWTPEEAARGADGGEGPDRSAPWVIVRAKSEGVTPGFTIKDARGTTWFIKFDAPGEPGTSISAGAIAGRIFHAAGYNVPSDHVVDFTRTDLVLGEGVRLSLPDGSKKEMTAEDLDHTLAHVEHNGTQWRAIASRLLDGKPIGPFDYKGRRHDDPNDHINHENRRELRGLRVFAAWLVHFDAKQQNSLDMFVEEDGRHFVKHHLIDFASTLGAGASGSYPAYGWEFSLDLPAIAGRTLALGMHEDAWRHNQRPRDLPEVGYFESARFDPLEFKPLVANTAFANMTDRDGYWAAKIISAFRDEHLRAIVAEGHYQDPRAAEYMARVLAERRDIIARHWFERVSPLDFFTFEPAGRGALSFHDLGVERGVLDAAAQYRARVTAVDAERDGGPRSDWAMVPPAAKAGLLVVDFAAETYAAAPGSSVDSYPFLRVELETDRGHGFGQPVTVYVARASGRVVEVGR